MQHKMTYLQMANELIADCNLNLASNLASDSDSDDDLPPVLYPEITLQSNRGTEKNTYSFFNNNLESSPKRPTLRPSISDVERRIEQIQSLVSDIKREIKLSNKQNHEPNICDGGTCCACGGYKSFDTSNVSLRQKPSITESDKQTDYFKTYETKDNETRPKRACAKRVIVIDSDEDDDESISVKTTETRSIKAKVRKRNEKLMKKCKPCSVVLVDFVHALDFEKILRNSNNIPKVNKVKSKNKSSSFQRSKLVGKKGIDKTPVTRKRKTNRNGFPTSKKNRTTYYQCLVCKFVTNYRFVILEHTYTHLHIFPFSCSKCNQMFTTKVSCNIHIKMQHKGTRTSCVKTVDIDEKEYYEIKTKPKATLPRRKTKPKQTIKEIISSISNSENPIYIENDSIPMEDVEPSAAHCNEVDTTDESPTRFRCRFCHFKSAFKHIIDDHFNTKHVEEHKYVCHLCDLAFCRKRETMVKHFKRWHPGKEIVLTTVPGYIDMLEKNNVNELPIVPPRMQPQIVDVRSLQNDEQYTSSTSSTPEIVNQPIHQLNNETIQPPQTEPENLSKKSYTQNKDTTAESASQTSPILEEPEVDILDLSMKAANIDQGPRNRAGERMPEMTRQSPVVQSHAQTPAVINIETPINNRTQVLQVSPNIVVQQSVTQPPTVIRSSSQTGSSSTDGRTTVNSLNSQSSSRTEFLVTPQSQETTRSTPFTYNLSPITPTQETTQPPDIIRSPPTQEVTRPYPISQHPVPAPIIQRPQDTQRSPVITPNMAAHQVIPTPSSITVTPTINSQPAVYGQPLTIAPSAFIEPSPAPEMRQQSVPPELTRIYPLPKKNRVRRVEPQNIYRPPPPLIRAVPQQQLRNNVYPNCRVPQHAQPQTHIYQNQRICNQTVFSSCGYGHDQVVHQEPIPRYANINNNCNRNVIQSQHALPRQLNPMAGHQQRQMQQVVQPQLQCQQTRHDQVVQHRPHLPPLYSGSVEVTKYQVFNLKPGQEKLPVANPHSLVGTTYRDPLEDQFGDPMNRGPPQLTPIYNNVPCQAMQTHPEQWQNYHCC